MYAVVCYFNYRKNQSVEILKTFSSLPKAINSAKKYACDKYTIVMDHVIIKKMLLDNCIIEFTEGTGYEKYVYAVVKIPETSDDEEEDEEENEHNVFVDDSGALFLDHSENDTENDTENNDCYMSDDCYMSGDCYMSDDDRYDEREDYDTGYGFDCGYEDEGYECCDL